MKILVTTGNLRHHLTPGFHNLLDEVARYTDLTVWHQPGNINEILNQLNLTPDFILINEFGETNAPEITGLAELSIPFAVALHDLHYQINQRKTAMEKNNVRYVFSLYRDKFYEWYPQFWRGLCWLPHHFDPHSFIDYGLKKDIDFLLMGAMHPVVYPLRHAILQRMQHHPGFVYHPHPGYRDFNLDEEALVGTRFAQEINRAKIFFTCDSAYHYPVAKYFEVLACNTLLLASSSRELLDLGFVPGEHFVAINEYNFEEKARYYLDHEEERIRIARQGYAMVQNNHSTSRRAIEMVAMIRKIITHEQGKNPLII